MKNNDRLVRVAGNVVAGILMLIGLPAAHAVDAPSVLRLTVTSPSSVSLSWPDTSTKEDGWQIERRISGGEFSPLVSLPANTTKYQDDTLTTGKTYIYRIAPTFKGVASEWIESRVALTSPAEPRGMLGWSLSGHKINLTWTDRSENETGFLIERMARGSDTGFVEVVRGITTNSYRDTNVVAGTIYTYRVRAYNAAGVSTFGEVTLKAGGAPPAPTSPKIPKWNVEAKVIYSKGFPGFMDIEIYQKDGRYYVRDRVKKADYKDPRPRRFYYVDMANIGPSLEEGYPLPERGGIYQIQCKRWAEGKDVWDLQNADVAMEWVIKPGPLGVAGELFIPSTFKFDTDDWRDQEHKAIPPFEPILGKATPSYRYNVDQTWEDILSRGASHTASAVGPHGPENMLQTVGDPIDALGQQGFAALSPEEITAYAAQLPPLAFYLTDWEKQPGWHDTPTYWSIDLPDEKVLQNYYFYLSELNRLCPNRKSGDYYRAIKWSHSFYVEGEARPLDARFIEQSEDPEKSMGPAFRPFTYTDGNQHSLREQCRVYTIDWYLKGNIFPDRRRDAIYMIYANLFDTINAKLVTPADSTILAFAWFGTDNDLGYWQYLRLEGGWMRYNNRIMQTPWWIMTATYIGHLFGDGFHWWHDNGPEGSDRNRHPDDYGRGPLLWEPDPDGPKNAPWVLGQGSEKGPLYPREPRYNLAYTKLAEYRLKQYESFLTMPRAVVPYSLDAGKTWVTPVGNERRDLLEKAEKKQPICFKWDAGGDLVMVFLSWPFAEAPEWNVTLKIAPGQERSVKMDRQWPMLRVFSKSNPKYGL